jgi:hypothetical protein
VTDRPPTSHLLDRNGPSEERVRRYAARIKAHADLVASQHPGVPVFCSWGQVPKGLRTRSQWDDQNHRVLSGSKPAGIFVWSETIEVRDGEGKLTGFCDVRCRTANLYGVGQTTPFVPTAREVAHRKFFDIFVRPSSRQRYGFWSDDDGHWKCVRGFIGKQRVRSHVNGASIYGVYGGTRSRFVAIDLDLHRGDRNVFLDRLEILLTEFGGKDGWHLQVADQSAGGVHLLKIVPETSLDALRAGLRASLQLMDHKHPEQARRARASGMKSLGEVEVYPNQRQVFRLPLCRGRTLLLDRPLALVENVRARNGVVQDVEGYIRWLEATPNATCPLPQHAAQPEQPPVLP